MSYRQPQRRSGIVYTVVYGNGSDSFFKGFPTRKEAKNFAKKVEDMPIDRDSGKIVSTRKYASSPGGKYTVADNVTYRIYDKKTGVETASYGL